MNIHKNSISQNLSTLRQYHAYSQEEVAEKIGVSRQAVSKWESGESLPDIVNLDALASLYDVSIDDLIHFDQQKEKTAIPPKGKHEEPERAGIALVTEKNFLHTLQFLQNAIRSPEDTPDEKEV